MTKRMCGPRMVSQQRFNDVCDDLAAERAQFVTVSGQLASRTRDLEELKARYNTLRFTVGIAIFAVLLLLYFEPSLWHGSHSISLVFALLLILSGGLLL